MQANLRAIYGGWDKGYALDKHMIRSVYLGDDEWGHAKFDNQRTEIGEAVYQLKYRQDFDRVPHLAQVIYDNVRLRFPNIGLVVPMPASKMRVRQPVHAVAEHLAVMLGVASFDKMLKKKALSKSLKDINDRAEKDAALAGTIQLSRSITNDGKWNALLIDDLYDTGASLDAACKVLREYEKIEKIYVTAMTWKQPK